MTTIFVSISGPGNAEDLENGGREVLPRNGHQVEDTLWDRLKEDGLFSLTWGDYTVEAEMP